MKEECWLYAGHLDKNGYGYVSHKHKGENMSTMMHKAVYLSEVGRIPERMELDHLCEIKSCINPTHLEPVTHKENMRRMRGNKNNYCIRGHELTPDNIYLGVKDRRTGRIGRQCRMCVLVRKKGKFANVNNLEVINV